MIDINMRMVAIVGPTASRKTELALGLAERFGGDIVCADSRTIYRGMDIGTAKPSVEEQARVPHHLLDVVAPDETFSAQEFKTVAEKAVGEIVARGHAPFLVGGTGLYTYSVVYDFQFPAGARTEERATLEQQPLAELVERLWQEDPERAGEIDLKNPRRVIRALETVGQPRQRAMVLPENILLLGLRPPEDELYKKIVQRTKTMFQIGLVDEVRKLVEEYGVDVEALKSPGYAEVVDYLAGRTTLVEAEELVTLHTRQLVKRQLTWFRRNADIRWMERGAEAEELVKEFLG